MDADFFFFQMLLWDSVGELNSCIFQCEKIDNGVYTKTEGGGYTKKEGDN